MRYIQKVAYRHSVMAYITVGGSTRLEAFQNAERVHDFLKKSLKGYARPYKPRDKSSGNEEYSYEVPVLVDEGTRAILATIVLKGSV